MSSRTIPGCDICVIGHVTKDVIKIPGRDDKIMAGGTVCYAAAALKALNRNVRVITRAAPQDKDILLQGMESLGVEVIAHPSKESTVFENRYEGAELAVRHQRVLGLAEPFQPEDAAHLHTRVVQLGPLTSTEMTPEFIAAVAASEALVALDIQGYTRLIEDGAVKQTSAKNIGDLLRRVGVIKADDTEAKALTGVSDLQEAARMLQRLGPQEILLTFADRGSMILDKHGQFHRIPAYPPKDGRIVDATGCGDTYFAGYLHYRMQSEDVEACGRFAAALSSIKLEDYGPFKGTAAEALARAGL